MATYKLRIPDLACSGCVEIITTAIQALEPTAEITADLATKQVMIQAQAPATTIHEAIIQAGYTPES